MKNVSISKVREQQQAAVANYQRICRELGRLKALGRLVDYMVRVSLDAYVV